MGGHKIRATPQHPPHTTRPGTPPAWGVMLFPGCCQGAQILSFEQETAQILRPNLLWDCHHRNALVSASSLCSRNSYSFWNLHLGMLQLHREFPECFLGTGEPHCAGAAASSVQGCSWGDGMPLVMTPPATSAPLLNVPKICSR